MTTALAPVIALLLLAVGSPVLAQDEDEQDAPPAKQDEPESATQSSHPTWWEGPWGLRLTDRGLELEDPDQGWSLRLGGRAHLDFVSIDDDVIPLDDGVDFRRLRYSFRARWGDWLARASRDFGGTIPGWKSLYLRYYAPWRVRVTVGNQIPPFSMEENTSSNDYPFLERSLANALAPGFRSGIAVSTRGDRWASAVGYFGNPIGSEPKGGSRGEGWYARATLAPVREKEHGTLVHVGASYSSLDIEPGVDRYRVRSRPESGITSGRLLDTGRIRNVQDTQTWGAESLLRYERLTLQGEYLTRRVDLRNTRFQFKGWYARAGLLLRGGQRPYSTRLGSLGSLEAEDEWGALELSGRISRLDLDSKLASGGYGTNYTLGLDWTLNRNLRFLAETILAKATPDRNGVDEEVHIYQLRMQVSF